MTQVELDPPSVWPYPGNVSDRPEHFRPWTSIDREDEDEVASAVCAIADGLEEEQEPRRQRMLDAVRRFEGRGISDLDAHSYVTEYPEIRNEDTGEVWESAVVNIHRSQVEAVYADIAARYKPSPRIITTGADWDTQVRSMRWNKFLVGQMRQRQGRYASVWEAMDRGAFRDCEITGEGYVKVFADFAQEKIAVERLYPWQVFADPSEALYGQPRTLVHVYRCDKERLIALFLDGDGPENEDGDEDESDDEMEAREERNARAREERDSLAAKRTKVRNANPDEPTGAHVRRQAQGVKVREIWTLASSADSPGRHAIVVDGVVLVDEDYPYFEHEIIDLRWADDVIGWGGQGLVQECAGMTDAFNHVLERVLENFTLRCGRRVYVPEASGVTDEALQSNESEVIIRYTGGQPPTESVVPPLNPGELDVPQYIYGLSFMATGVPQASAAAQTTLGAGASGKAMRTEKELGTARMLSKGNMRDNAYKRLFRLMIRCGHQISKEKPSFTSTWPGRDFLRRIPWSESAITDESMYEVEVQTEPRNARWSVAGRTAAYDEAFAAGMVSPESYQRVTDGTLDIAHENEGLDEEYNAVQEDIEYLLETDPGDADFVLTLPDGFITDKPTALAISIREYFRARRKSAPEERLRGVRNYIHALDLQIKRMTMPQGPPPGGAMPPGAGGPPQMAGGAPAAPPTPQGAPPVG